MKHYKIFQGDSCNKYLVILLLLFQTINVKSQIIELAVGQGTYLYTPSAPYPYTYVSSAAWDNSEAPNVGFADGDIPNETYAHVGVRSAFSGVQKITCYYICSGFINGHVRASPPLTKSYYIRCVGGSSAGGGVTGDNYSEASLPNSITISVGQEFDLSPYLKESTTLLTTDPNVATLHSPAMLKGEGPGTCTVGFITATQTYGCKVVVPEPKMALIVWNNNGGANTFKFTEKPKLSMQSNVLMVQTTMTNIEYPLVDVERISLIDLELDEAPSETTSIKSVESVSSNVEFRADMIKFMNCPPNSRVSISSINGIQMDSYTVKDDGTLTISIAKYGKGIYIVSSNIANYKIIKK